MSYTCPRCGAVSHNPNDGRERYCGRCHRFEEHDEMARALIINDTVKREVVRALTEAAKRPISFATVKEVAVATEAAELKLSDRKPGVDYKRGESVAHVSIPHGYRASISFEEQPVGLCKHLSISVDEGRGGKLPSMESVKAVAELFGMDIRESRVWLEEFEPGRSAVNLVAVAETKTPSRREPEGA